MAASAALVAQLRRMVAELGVTTYSDSDLEDIIERYPLEDARGEAPWVESTVIPGTLEENEDWTATYDLHAAAADVWQEKAVLALSFDEDSLESIERAKTQKERHELAMEQTRYHRSRRAITTVTLRPEPLYQGTEEATEEIT